jgi:RHS repeat-associated protein
MYGLTSGTADRQFAASRAGRSASIARALALVSLLTGLLFVLVASVPAGALAEPLCTDAWTGPTEGNWQTASDWSTGKVPGSADVACVEAGRTVAVTAGTNQAGVLLDKGALVISGGSLELANAFETSSAASLTLQSATLTGAGTLNVTNSLTWLSEGTMSGAGKTVLGSGASGRIEGEAGAGNPLLTERTLVNEGVLTLGGPVGAVTSEGARFENRGTFKANSAAGFSIGVPTGSKIAPSILNTGTFEKTEHEGTTRITPAIENSGAVSATTGHLSFNTGGSSTSTSQWSASEGASVIFAAGSFSLNGGKWSGTMAITGGNVTAEGVEGTTANVNESLGEAPRPGGSLNIPKGTMTVSSLTLETLTLTGAGTLNVTNSLTWLSEGTMSGAGKTVLGSGASGRIEGEAGAGNVLLTERTLVNEGVLTAKGSTEALMSEGARFENRGTFKANSADAYSINVPTGSKIAPSILNTGTFEKTEHEGTTRVVPQFDNTGRILVEIGHLDIEHPVVTEQSTQYGGPGNPSAPGHPCPVCGDPVVASTGNFVETQTDLSVDGRGVGLGLTRTYNSQAAAEGSKGLFGYGWSNSFSDRLVVESGKTTLHQPNGATVPFTESVGAFVAPVWSQDKLSGGAEAGYTLTLPNQTQYRFAGSGGRLERVTDRNGNATTLTYSEAGRLEAVTDPAGRKLTVAYNAEGLVESAKDPMGHEAKYEYEAGQLAKVIEPGETLPRWQFKYDASHQVTTMTDARGGKTTNEYNAGHQVALQTDPMERKLSFEYGSFHTRVTNKTVGAVTDEYFTSNDEPSSVTRAVSTPSASTESYTYNAGGYLTSDTDGNGHTRHYGYDVENNRTSMVDANEHETKWGYNATHDVISSTTPKGETTTIKRDSHGNPEAIERSAPVGQTQATHYKYKATGELESVEDPLKRVWKYEYDSKGDRSAEEDAAKDKRTWEYNEDSNEIATVSPRGSKEPLKFTTKVERDAQERPIKVTDPLGHETKYKYDTNGNLETVTDPLSHATTYEYDADNEPVKVKEANGDATETGYDGSGRVISQTDGNKHTTKYARNALGEVTEVLDPLSRKTVKEYDAAGNLKTLTDPAKRTTTYAYDPASRLTEVSYSDGKTPTVKYEYDSDGNRTGMVDGTGTSTYGYDQLDRLTEAKDGHGDTTGYEYDLANQQTKLTYPNGKSVLRAYDQAGRLEKVTDWLEHTTSFAYDTDSDQTKTIFPTGTTNEDKYTYNVADQLTKTEFKKGTEILASLVYARDLDGQLKQTTQKGLPGEEKTAYTYDANNRLTKAGTTGYEYDAANNPKKLGSVENTFDAADELTKATGVEYSYNELGERTKRTPTGGPATTYSYDQAGNLTTIQRPAEGEATAIEDSYGYDGKGLRMSQTISGSTSHLAWDATASLPLLLADGERSYIYGPGNLAIEQIDSEGKAVYLHHDQQGSTRLLTGGTGASEASMTFDPYGNQIGHTGTVTTPAGYNGQYTNTDTGLIYLRARVYDPSTAQLLSVDPLVGMTGAPYAYASDNPLNTSDPSGLLPSWAEEGIEGLAGWGDTLTLGATKWAREQLGDENVNTCSTAYIAGGFSGLATGVLIPGEGAADLGVQAAERGIAGVIKGYTEHGLAQAMARDGGRGVSPSAILDAVRSPLADSVQADGATKYVGQNAVVVVGSDGRIVTTYARNSAGLRDRP